MGTGRRPDRVYYGIGNNHSAGVGKSLGHHRASLAVYEGWLRTAELKGDQGDIDVAQKQIIPSCAALSN